MKRLFRVLLLVAWPLAVPGQAAAQELSPAVLAAPCASCHGPGGRSPGAIPPLEGLPAEEIAAMMHGFQTGEIEGTVMNRIARGYTVEEIDLIAAYFAELGQ